MDELRQELLQVALERDALRSELKLSKERISELEKFAEKLQKSEMDNDRSSASKASVSSRCSVDDELTAWKELVDQQRILLSKMTIELEETQAKLRALEKEVMMSKEETKVIDQECQTIGEVQVGKEEKITNVDAIGSSTEKWEAIDQVEQKLNTLDIRLERQVTAGVFDDVESSRACFYSCYCLVMD
ncbi:MAG: hypothetical protein O7C56_04770 [Rickettsia endosymbiont of Ixodes persulcatus]|nr:hypothetical protein [Rickettsia endosymbiont of Ixodes persulcatus]